MKFNELLKRTAAVVPASRQIVFKTIIIAFCASAVVSSENSRCCFSAMAAGPACHSRKSSTCRRPLAVENHFDLCCFAMSLTWIYAFKLDHAPDRRHPGKRAGTFAFADIRRKISDDLAGESILPGRCTEGLVPAEISASTTSSTSGCHRNNGAKHAENAPQPTIPIFI